MLKEMGIIYLTTMDEYVCATVLAETEQEEEGQGPVVPLSSCLVLNHIQLCWVL